MVIPRNEYKEMDSPYDNWLNNLLLGLMVILDFTRLGIIKRYIIDYIIIFMKGNYKFPIWLTRLIALLVYVIRYFSYSF